MNIRNIACLLLGSLFVFGSSNHVAGASDPAVAKHSIGIETLGGAFAPIIKKGATLPTHTKQTIATADDDQNQITLRVFQGDSEKVADNKALGRWQIREIPPAPGGRRYVVVTFQLDLAEYFLLTARDKTTDRALPVVRLPANDDD